MPTVYPCVPGHEIVGRVTKVGSAVTKFKPGDLAAVGCLVDSDGTCPECKAGFEQFCPNYDPHLQLPRQASRAASPTAATPTASSSTSASCCAFRRTSTLPGAAPLLCAGITTYSPHAPLGRDQGQEGRRRRSRRTRPHGREVRARVWGAHVVVFTTSPGKKDDALRLGADEVVVSRNADEMAEARRQLRLHSRRRLRRARHQRLHQPARAATATSRWSARRRSRCPSPSSA